MQTHTKEHEEVMQNFEKLNLGRLDREKKTMWSIGAVYQCGEVNRLFLIYRQGFALAKGMYQ